MDRTNSGGHKVAEGGKGAMEGKGASSSEMGMDEGGRARQGVRQRLRKAGEMGEGEP